MRAASRSALAALILLVAAVPAPADEGTLAPLQGAAVETASPPGLPMLGKWMIAPDAQPSDWLGERLDGKTLREPINIVVVDGRATTAEEARTGLLAALDAAGFPDRFGHSAGYSALIGGTRFPEWPPAREHAFSDRFFALTNDHGRLFGPFAAPEGFVFSGAFSRERVDPFRDPGHRFASFVEARDRLAAALAATGQYRQGPSVPLDNALRDDPLLTTGDHDGMAAVIVRE